MTASFSYRSVDRNVTCFNPDCDHRATLIGTMRVVDSDTNATMWSTTGPLICDCSVCQVWYEADTWQARLRFLQDDARRQHAVEYLRWCQATPQEAYAWLRNHPDHGGAHGTIDIMMTLRDLLGLGIDDLNALLYQCSTENRDGR